jgi:hypothetical protein
VVNLAIYPSSCIQVDISLDHEILSKCLSYEDGNISLSMIFTPHYTYLPLLHSIYEHLYLSPHHDLIYPLSNRFRLRCLHHDREISGCRERRNRLYATGKAFPVFASVGYNSLNTCEYADGWMKSHNTATGA